MLERVGTMGMTITARVEPLRQIQDDRSGNQVKESRNPNAIGKVAKEVEGKPADAKTREEELAEQIAKKPVFDTDDPD